MFKFTNVIIKSSHVLKTVSISLKNSQKCRTFLSQAYYCNELWQKRTNNPLLKKINIDQFYNEIDQKYSATKTISAVDVDIFVNAIDDELFTDELLDLVHKLRLSADSCNTLESTHHAIVRNLIQFGKKDELLNVLDDRLNYGIFLDNYTACILMDTFWKQKDYVSGARIAAQLMLQEDFEHGLSSRFSLLHCYNYLLNSCEWPQPEKIEDDGEEITIRIKYLRNPYNDNHFDLKDGNKIVGKILMMITKNPNNILEKSLHLIGLALFEEPETTKNYVDSLIKNNDKVYDDVLKLISKDNASHPLLSNLNTEKADMQQLLQDTVKLAEQTMAEKDIVLQCNNYAKWDQERLDALEKQKERYLKAERLANIEKFKNKLDEKETLLWYFENEEKYELEIEAKQAEAAEITHKRVKKLEDVYIPPEVGRKFN